jgi:isoleucyl-tRNA synthetase
MARYDPVDPQQSFPDLEQEILERWRERDVFAESVRRRQGAEPYVFYEGPPTANGRPGSHHVLSRVFKDVFPRYRTMRGNLVHRKGGWDCHGLPVELEIERELGFTVKDDIERYGIAEFNAKCRESVLRYIDEWHQLTERIGFWIDTDDAYYTLDDDYIESVWWSLKQVWDKGLLYEGHKVVPYCPRCGTALSSHEVSLGYKDVVDLSAYVRFPVRGEQGVSLVGWTTTPWTLLSNAALAVHPDVTYVRAHVDGTGTDGASTSEQLILAEPLVERVLGEGVETSDPVKGSELVGTAYEPPFDYVTDFGPKSQTVLPADFVTTEDGTGVVHTALAFGEDDFNLGEEQGLTLQNPVRPDGTFDDRMGPFAGRKVKETDPDVVEALRASGRLLRAEDYEHSYPHCWRCDTALLYYAKSSWYVRTTAIKDQLLAANEDVTWYPDHIKHGRFGNWLENNVDWALSRERYWGTPLPIWRADDGEVICVGSRAELAELGAEVPEDLHRPYVDDATFERDGKTFRRVPDLIDVWWDSGSMPFAQWHAPFENQERFDERFPADYICEALDQTRGWFYSLLAISTLLYGRASFETVLCLGLILDPEGQKMSKSRGNTVSPWEVLDTHGADAFRWYYFTSKQPWDGYRFSVETVGESVRQFLKTLWNTYGFFTLYANVNDVAPAALEDVELTDLDSWALSRLQAVSETCIERLDDYDTTNAGRAISAYVDELSNWYVRRSRRRFWDGDPAAFATLRACLVGIAKLVAPLTPFVAEALYGNLDGAEPSVHLCDYPEPDPSLRDERLEWQMSVARETVGLGREARAHGRLKVRQPLREAVVVAAGEEREAIERFDSTVREELNVKAVRYATDADELGDFELKPNYRALGPRFGKDMPQVAEAVAGLDASRAAATLREGGEVHVSIGGREHPLGPDDVQLALQPLDGYQVERSGAHAVALDTVLDEELRAEGLAREVVHAVQNARKDAGLEVEDRIAQAQAGDEGLLDAVRSNESYVTGETLATSLAFDADGGAATTEIEGRELRIAVRRATHA